MPDERAPRRFFSEKEIGTVLRRATELQESAKTTDPTGLTFDELQQIAEEAGIDPQYLATAVAGLDAESEADERFHWLGAPTTISLDRVVEGDVSEEQWETMVAEIRKTFKLVGTSGRVGRSREWTHDSKEQQAQVTVTSREGQTKLRVFAHYLQLAVVTFLPALSMSIVPLMVILAQMPPWLGVPFALAMMGTLMLGLRFLFSRLIRAKQRQARELLTRLEQIIAEASKETALQPLSEETARLNASLLDGEATPEEVPAQTPSRAKTSSS